MTPRGVFLKAEASVLATYSAYFEATIAAVDSEIHVRCLLPAGQLGKTCDKSTRITFTEGGKSNIMMSNAVEHIKAHRT